jgi:hypothetical protein
LTAYRGSYFAQPQPKQPQPKKRNGNAHKKENYYAVEHLGKNCGRRGREWLTTPAGTQK